MFKGSIILMKIRHGLLCITVHNFQLTISPLHFLNVLISWEEKAWWSTNWGMTTVNVPEEVPMTASDHLQCSKCTVKARSTKSRNEVEVLDWWKPCYSQYYIHSLHTFHISVSKSSRILLQKNRLHTIVERKCAQKRSHWVKSVTRLYHINKVEILLLQDELITKPRILRMGLKQTPIND